VLPVVAEVRYRFLAAEKWIYALHQPNPKIGAEPTPTLTLGIRSQTHRSGLTNNQNDGFRQIL
jgi:hypothetical protein